MAEGLKIFLMFGAMAGASEANSGGRHPAVLTSDANAVDRPLCVVDANCGGSHSALPALDAEILTAVRALNRYPKRGKAQAENLLAKRIAKRWPDLLPSTREKLQALQKSVEEELQAGMVQKLCSTVIIVVVILSIIVIIIILILFLIITVIVTIIVILNNIWGRRWCNFH